MSRFASGASSGGKPGVVIIIILICCFSFVVGSVYGVAEISDKSKTGIETIQELINGTKTLTEVINSALGDETDETDETDKTDKTDETDETDDPIAFDCKGSFIQWGTCDKTCGNGKQTRTWTVQEEETGGGSCPDRGKIEERECNTNPCPINCVGSWNDTTPGGECRYGCGTETRNESYSITTASAHGGTSCPHAAGDSRTQDCGNPACPTVDTTETIDGIEFQVKYYDDRDGHSKYSYYNTELGFFWEGNKKEMTGLVSGEKRGGTDGYYYIIGTTQNNELKWRQTTEEYIKKSIIKRSVNAVAPVEDTNGTCKRSPTNHASKTANGWWIDYDCNGICTSKTSKGNCLDIHTYCDYQHSSGSGQRSNARLDSACEWVPN
jgi:hypothetical protein